MDHRSNPYPLVNVTNGAGSGKTALALRVAHDLAADYPGGQLFLELSQAGLPELDAYEALFRLLLQLRVAENRIPESLPGRIELFHAELRERSLLVLDSVTSVNQVRDDLLPDRADCGVLMTSRRSFAELEGIRELDLGSMPEDEAFALLENRTATRSSARSRHGCSGSWDSSPYRTSATTWPPRSRAPRTGPRHSRSSSTLTSSNRWASRAPASTI